MFRLELHQNDFVIKLSKFSLLPLFFVFLCNPSTVKAQNVEEEAFAIRKIYDKALTESSAHKWLEHLTTKIGQRLSGSSGAAAAVEYTRQMMDSLGVDSVWLQPCMVPHWVRGEKETVRVINSATLGSIDLKCLALGNSIGTGKNGVHGEIVEVQSLDELDKLGETGLKGKIVFFNKPMDPTRIHTFEAYGNAGAQRYAGPLRAAKYGAIAAVVRSLTNNIDDVPHTGSTTYDPKVKNIPAVAISTKAAELLSSLLKRENIKLYIQTNCQMLGEKLSYNVIGEVWGSKNKNNIIAVGGHLDSWDVAQGAHDDGTGCVQAMSVLQLLKQINYKPNNTIRAVMFMNEENGLKGGQKYAEESNRKKEFHLAALESDSGGFSPRGFKIDAEESVFNNHFKAVTKWASILEPYGLNMRKGGGGADINPLKSQKGVLIGLDPDSQRYFDFHHTEKDVFEAVNKRELELGAAALCSIIYLIDKYDLK